MSRRTAAARSVLTTPFSRRHALLLTLAGAAAPALAACNDTEPVSGSTAGAGSGSTSGSSAASTATAMSDGTDMNLTGGVRKEVRVLGNTLDIAVGPAAVVDDTTVVRVAMSVTDSATEGESFSPSLVWDGETQEAVPVPCGARLLDLDAGTVRQCSATLPMDFVGTDGAPVAIALTFSAVDTDSVDVLLPNVGLFTGVPVVTAADAGYDTAAAITAAGIDPTVATEALTLMPCATDPNGYGDTSISGDTVSIVLGSDVLFGVDSSELSDQARASLDQVAAALPSYGGGTLTITGHTDDVADDAHNQTLSEQRAQAVADYLGQKADLSDFKVSVEGKGETEPRVPNSDDASRAVNRRVEMVIVANTPPDSTPVITGATSWPTATGLTATGAEGVSLTNPDIDGGLRLEVVGVTRRGGYLVGEFRLTGLPVEDPGTYVYEWFNTDAWDSPFPGDTTDGALVSSTKFITLLAGSMRHFPAAYLQPDSDRHVFATEMNANLSLREGDEQRLTSIWPDTGEDTLLVDYGLQPADYFPTTPFRLTDVPVTVA